MQQMLTFSGLALSRCFDLVDRNRDELKFLPVFARRTDWVALIDGTSGQILGYAPFDAF